jgi:predicted flap endonuclease-1-like 5' DNA nuclease
MSREIKMNEMANYKIEDVEGIGPAIGAKLRKAGVINTDKLLENSKTPKQRKKLAEDSGLTEKQILRFANMVDLYRIKGIGSEFSELLEASGVDTVPELAQRSAENLTKKMEEVNAEKKLCRRAPSLKEVTDWVAQAKKLPRVLEY